MLLSPTLRISDEKVRGWPGSAHTTLMLLAWGHTGRTTDLNNYSEFVSWHRTPSCLRPAYTQVQVFTIMYHGQFTDRTLKRCVSENGTQGGLLEML